MSLRHHGLAVLFLAAAVSVTGCIGSIGAPGDDEPDPVSSQGGAGPATSGPGGGDATVGGGSTDGSSAGGAGGSTGSSCGDGTCDSDEDCDTCPQDCECVPVCGDGQCNGAEDCTICPDDCGVCTGCGDGECTGTEDCSSCPDDCGGVPIPANFAGVNWLHTDVSGWAETANLQSVTVSSSQICLNYDKASEWPGVNHVGAFVNGNPWIFIRHNHAWYAATWEWLRHEQTCKNKSSVAGDHIKQNPFWNFQPRSGACYGFMVSGLARDSVRNVYERSQVKKIQWP